MSPLRNRIRSCSLVASLAAITARRKPWRRASATARDVGTLTLLLAAFVYSSFLPGVVQLAFAAAIAPGVLILLMPGATRRRLVARAGTWLCQRLGLDGRSMSRARRSEGEAARAVAALAASARAALMIASDLARRLVARMLAALGAVATTTQPRFAASLTAGFAALQRS